VRLWGGAVAPGALAVATALALSWPAGGTAAPLGVIHKLPQPTHVHDIAAGSHGELWFATSRHTVGWIGPRGTVHRFDLPKGETPVSIIPARGGRAAWFTWNRLVNVKGRPVIAGIGRVTAAGHLVHFRGPGDPLFLPHELVIGTGGNLWFNSIDESYAGEDVIGRMTPGGKFATFGADPSEDSFVTDVTAGGDGNVWFGDDEQGTVDRITPAGEITRFEGGLASLQPHLYRLAAAPDGSVYFSLEGRGRYGIGRVRPGGDTVRRFTRGLSPRVNEIGSLAVGPYGDVWFSIERKGPPGTTASPDGRAAIGRLTPSGTITEFSRCLRPATLPGDLTAGPGHDVWFLSGYGLSNADLTPGVGRITPAGQITEFREGLGRADELEDLVSDAGRLWFIDRRGGTIAELRPPRGKAAPVLVEFPESRHHGVGLRVTVPGPGTVRIREIGVATRGHVKRVPGLGTQELRASACGPISAALPGAPPLQRVLEERGQIRLVMNVTFTPRGGKPFHQRAAVRLVPG
jgi:virginiamycin B lyase